MKSRSFLGAFLCAAAISWPCAAGADEAGCAAPVSADAAAPAQAQARETTSTALFTRPESTVPPAKRTIRGLYVTAADAFEMIGERPASVLFVDVRTRAELQFIGMPTIVDAHVPYLVEAAPLQWDESTSAFRLAPNPDFVAAVDLRLARKGLARDAVVVLICQSGVRAARAADVLTRAGYANVYSVIDGFEGDAVADGPSKGLRLVNGWRNAGLPWTTRLERSKMYGLD